MEEVKQIDLHEQYTPIKRLKPILSECKRNILLYFGGSFYPIHKNHIRTLEFIKQQINLEMKDSYNIVGAYIVPTHQSNLKKKLQTYNLVSTEARLDILNLALRNSDWIDVDSFLIHQKTNIGLAQTKKLTQDYINNVLGKMPCNEQAMKKSKNRVTCVTVLGVDNFDKIAKQIQRELVVIIKNRKDFEFDVESNIIKFNLQKFRSNLLYFEDKSVDYNISSTILREMINNSDKDLPKYIDDQVLDYHIKNKIQYFSNTFPNNSNVSKPIVYINIDDCLKFQYNKIKYEDIKFISQDKEKDVLGEGAQAKVYKAIYQGQEVAVKIFDLKQGQNQKLKYFLRELKALVTIHHKNVITCLGAGQQNNELFIVLELGLNVHLLQYLLEDKKQWKNKYRMPSKWVYALSKLADGLYAMSKSGVLHRDLTVNNFLIVPKSISSKQEEQKQNCKENNIQLKITDFGVSAFETDKHQIVRGSTRHYAPEAIIDKNNYCVASDVYSFGNAMYEMINLKHIFSSWTVKDVQEKVVKGERPQFNKKSENKFQYIIEMCWKQNPNERPTFNVISELLNKEAQLLEEIEKKEESINQKESDSEQKQEQSVQTIKNNDCVAFE